MIIEYVNRDLYFIFPLTILELYSQPCCLASKSRMLKSYLIFPTSFPSSDLPLVSWAAHRKNPQMQYEKNVTNWKIYHVLL